MLKIKLKLGVDHKKYIKSFGMHYELDKEALLIPSEVKDKIVISVKTVVNENEPVNPERDYDNQKMRDCHYFFTQNRKGAESMFKLPTEYNKSVVWIEDKEEWMQRPAEKCNTRYVVENHMIPYDEALRRLKK